MRKVDEIECKVFIKNADSNLLRSRGERLLRDVMRSEATAGRRFEFTLMLSVSNIRDKLSTRMGKAGDACKTSWSNKYLTLFRWIRCEPGVVSSPFYLE